MISFIIPTLNEEKIIEKTLRCLKGYAGPHEIIIADGNSTDRTLTIAEKYADRIVRHEHNQRQTIAAAKNAGAKVARGEYLLFLDADMFIPDPDSFFHIILARFAKRRRLVALTVPLRVFPEMETLGDRIVFSAVNFLYQLLNNVFGIGAGSGEFQMVRNDAFKTIRGFNEMLVVAEDQDLFRRLRKIGATHLESELRAYHTGRRAHAIGWPTLLWQWFINAVSVRFRGRAAHKEWKVIR